MSSSTMTDPNAIKEYMLAGRGELTVRSVETGKRFTFRFRRVPNRRLTPDTIYETALFVHMLAGPDNESDYNYIGLVYQEVGGGRELFFRAQYPASAALGDTAAEWLVSRTRQPSPLDPEKVEVWNSGKCRRCGRKLTSEWAHLGIGPKCAEMEN